MSADVSGRLRITGCSAHVCSESRTTLSACQARDLVYCRQFPQFSALRAKIVLAGRDHDLSSNRRRSRDDALPRAGAKRERRRPDRLPGCVVERGENSVLLATSADERIRVETTWLRPEALGAALTDCVTITVLTVDGRYVAESIEAGDEPNEVNAVTNETTNDRERRQHRRDDDNGSGKKKS